MDYKYFFCDLHYLHENIFFQYETLSPGILCHLFPNSTTLIYQWKNTHKRLQIPQNSKRRFSNDVAE